MTKNTERTKTYLISGFIFVLLFTHLPVFYTVFYHNITGSPSAKDGNITLTSFSSGQTIFLDGNWEFFWNRLIATEQTSDEQSPISIKVPDYWSKYEENDKTLPAGGYGSYRLNLQGLQYSQPVTVYIPDFRGAYRVFIDGILTSESGVISKDSDKIFTVPQTKLYPLTLSAENSHEIIIEVASTRFSGLYKTPVLKDYNSALRQISNIHDIRFILFGTVLFSFFILIIVYVLSFRRNKHSLWLPVMIFFVLLRIMLTTEFYSFWQHNIFLNLSYESTNELMFFVTFVLKFLLIFLIQEQFGITFSKKEKYIFFFYYTLIYFAYLFIPHVIYNRYLTILLPVLTFALEFYSFFKLYFSNYNLKKFGILVYFGVILAISGLIVDCYYINGNIYPNLSLTLLIMLSLYLVILSLVYALRMADVYNNLAVSSSLLESAKIQIEMQKEYYNSLSLQMDEIRGIKHDTRHFVGVIKRLSDEGHYDELNKFLYNYTDKIESDPLPVFCENIVSNSILGYYSLKSKENSIAFSCSCNIQKQLPVTDSDLCVVLGNALENAVEACKKIKNKDQRFISVQTKTINNQMLIKIQNSYNGYLKIKDNSYISTKNGKLHGIGIQNIKRVIEAYGGFVKTEHTENTFTLMAAFPDSLFSTK